MQTSRRDFLALAPAAAAAASLGLSPLAGHASALGLPVGLQLYSVRDLLPKDFAGTLKQIAAIGFKEVESAGYYHLNAPEVKAAIDAAGLSCPSAHHPFSDLAARFDEILEFDRAVGAKTIICASPGRKNAGGNHEAFTQDDWKFNAENFNKFGERAKAAGMAFGYHNHVVEFTRENGLTGLDILIHNTDPALVTFEMDCGWVVVGGGNPVEYLKRYTTRFSMLHVKDFKKIPLPATPANPAHAAELGTGMIDYKPIFAAAKAAHIRHLYIEQEQFDIPPFQSLRIDYDYVHHFPA